MNNLSNKIDALVKLADYMLSEDEAWLAAKEAAVLNNQWFTAEQVELAISNIVSCFLQRAQLEQWLAQYTLSPIPKRLGLTMAGNIPLVGFHDFLCGYLSGHQIMIKYSSKDKILLPHLITVLAAADPAILVQVQASDMLKNCDAYIATGSNNSARYFEQYFAKYPHIIRRNRTSVAVLNGSETAADLEALANDVFAYFGLGCRNVTQICVPKDYNFDLLFAAFAPYKTLINHHKYNNNYDYHLAVYLLNRVPYLSNDALLLVENEMPFSAVAVLHYRYYTDKLQLLDELKQNNDIQCIVAKGFVPFGAAQLPSLYDYADGVDTMQFLCSL